jgi:hypothetical protein
MLVYVVTAVSVSVEQILNYDFGQGNHQKYFTVRIFPKFLPECQTGHNFKSLSAETKKDGKCGN